MLIWCSDLVNKLTIGCHQQQPCGGFVEATNGDHSVLVSLGKMLGEEVKDGCFSEGTFLLVDTRANVPGRLVEGQCNVVFRYCEHFATVGHGLGSRIELKADVLHHLTVDRYIACPNGIFGVSLGGKGPRFREKLVKSYLHAHAVRLPLL